MVTIESTIEFIRQAHQGQFDKAGAPYYLHPVAVMRRLAESEDDTIKIAALLHDVLEDTPYTKSDLLNLGYSRASVEIVELLTSSKTQPDYANKIRSIIASGNRGAILVKYVDMSENSDPKRLALLPHEIQQRLKAKYAGPLALLQEALTKII